MASPGTTGPAHFPATPHSGRSSRRSSRRSWFDTPPVTKLEIAMEQPAPRVAQAKNKRRSIDDIETLVLTHFTKPPRIGFGKIILGRSKTRMLMVQNPSDYEQDVVVERFPFKKSFNIDQMSFTVGPNDVVSLTLTWTPQEAGNCREMILFHVNGVYRLQAFVFGTADDPKPPKKVRKGMLGARKVKQPMECVVQTAALTSICKSYSPRRSEEIRDLRSQLLEHRTMQCNQENIQPPKPDELLPQTPPPLESTAICKNDENVQQAAIERRKSGFSSPTVTTMSPIPVTADNTNGHIVESYFCPGADMTHLSGEKRRSVERSPLKALPAENQISSQPLREADAGGANSFSPASPSAQLSGGCASAPSTQLSRGSVGRELVMTSDAYPSSQTAKKGEHFSSPVQRKKTAFIDQAKHCVSPKSFLNDSRNTVKPSTPEIGTIKSSNQIDKVKEAGVTSPNSFLKDMTSGQNTLKVDDEKALSPSTFLNSSIPHDVMLRHLETVRTSLHESSFHAETVAQTATVVKHETRAALQGTREEKTTRNVFAYARSTSAADGKKREKFLQRKVEEKARFAKISDVPSPRRKTFLVKKKKVSPMKRNTVNTKTRRSPTRKPAAGKKKFSPKRTIQKKPDAPGSAREDKIVITKENEKLIVQTGDTASNVSSAEDHADLDNTMSKKRRSQWASPAVVGFLPPVLATKSESSVSSCQSLGNSQTSLTIERHSRLSDTVTKMSASDAVQEYTVTDVLEAEYASVFEETVKTGAAHSAETVATEKQVTSCTNGKSEAVENFTVSNFAAGVENTNGKVAVTGLENSSQKDSSQRLSAGRKLFPDVAPSDSFNESSFKPLFAGISGTVTKERPSVSPHTSGLANTSGRKLFPDLVDQKSEVNKGADGKKDESMPKERNPDTNNVLETVLSPSHFQFNSPHILATSPSAEATRRTTSTVTKSRPSQALLDANERKTTRDSCASTSPENDTKILQGNKMPATVEEEDVWQTETIIIEHRNSQVVSVSFQREHLTPSTDLPTSPKSENSRRSTHAVRNPVVLNKDGMIRKNLFAPVEETRIVQCTEQKKDEQIYLDENREADSPVSLIKPGVSAMSLSEQKSPAVFTDRTEQHVTVSQKPELSKQSQFSAVPVMLNASTSSHELSTDSLEPETRAGLSSLAENRDLEDETESNFCRNSKKHDGTYDSSLFEGKEFGKHVVEKKNDSELFENKTTECASDMQCMSDAHPVVSCATSASDRASDLMTSIAEKTNQQDPSLSLQAENSATYLDSRAADSSSDVGQIRLSSRKGSSSVDPPQGKLTEATLVLTQTLMVEKLLKEDSYSLSTQDERDVSSAVNISAQREKHLRSSDEKSLQGTHEKHLEHADRKILQMSDQKNLLCSDGKGQSYDEKRQYISSSHQPVSRPLTASGTSSKNPIAFTVTEEKRPKLRRVLSAEITPKKQQAPKQMQRAMSHTILQSQSGSLKNIVQQPAKNRHQRSSTADERNPETFNVNGKRLSPDAAKGEPRRKRVELEIDVRQKVAAKPPQVAPVGTRRSTAAGKSTKPVKGLAQSKLILVKKPKTALPKHPLPFAAKNIYYDERWQDKQERGFVHWLNFVLTPADEYNLATTKKKVDARTIAFDGPANKVAPRLAPTKEVLSFRAYAARRRLNHLRRASCRLFQSEEVAKVVCRIEVEVENRRLAVRTDRMIHADIGIKQRILDVLLSYNPLWLRIGLETVYGEILPLHSNSDVIGLSRFILTRLLSSPNIAAQYSHPTVPHLYQEGYADAVAQHTLKKFLLLVYFLDRAKQSRLIAHDPCLFCKDSEVKSTKEVLVQFSRDYLSGEGDITKHLAYLGYVVSHVQTPLDEFDYAVSNLCTDLRDGVRLGRIVMLLSGDWSVAPSLRAPAISRLQKIHNLEVVFKHLTQRGLDLSTAKGGMLNPRDIVDGHRERTLAFLWKLIFHFQTAASLNEAELQEEVKLLERTLRVRLCMQRLLLPHRVTEGQARRDSGAPGAQMDNPMLQLLLKWARTVCLHYGVRVENFTVSFSDGRALCCLVHHYHPALLPLTQVQFQTTQSYQEAAEAAEEGTMDGESDLSQDWGADPFTGDMDPELFDKLLANERENFKTLYEKVSELGGIPLMLKASDMSNTIPDERVVVTYVSYMCARLLDLREETRAARIIQLAWRRYCLRRSARERQKKIAACVIIQRAVRAYLAKVHSARAEAAAVQIQALWRGYQGRVRAHVLREAKRNSQMHDAATVLQTHIRSHLARKHYWQQKAAAVKIQAWVRGRQAQQSFQKRLRACRQIQRSFRSHKQMAVARNDFLTKKHSAVILQRAFREKQERVCVRKNNAACKLQSAWRGLLCRKDFIRKKQAAMVIQAWWKMVQARRRFLKLRSSSVVIQQHYRAARLAAEAQQEFRRMKSAVITLQAAVRGYQQRRKYLQKRFWKVTAAAVTFQKHFRRYKCQTKYKALRLATIILQRAVRAHQTRNFVRNAYLETRKACITIQRWYRRQKRLQADKREAAAVVIQSHVRSLLARRELVALRLSAKRDAAATKIQSFVRCQQARGRYLRTRASIVLLQAYIRGYQARQRFREMKAALSLLIEYTQIQEQYQRVVAELHQKWAAAVCIQAWWRGVCMNRAYQETKAAAVKVQSVVRGHLHRKRYLQVKKAAVVLQRQYRAVRKQRAAVKIQAWWRMSCEKKRYQETRIAVVCLQAQARKLITRNCYLRLRQAALIVQQRYRALREGRSVCLQYRLMVGAAVVIQSCWKMFVVRQCYIRLRQQVVRAQAHCRRYLAVRRYQAMHSAAVCLQRQYRARLAGQQVRQEYLTSQQAVIRLQAFARGVQQRRHFLETRTACVRLQTAVRGWMARRQYQQQHAAIVSLQRKWRLLLEGRHARDQYLKTRQVIIKLQACTRGWLQHKQYQAERDACVKIQATIRMWKSYKQYRTQKQAAIILQQWWRTVCLGRKIHSEYTSTLTAIIRLQAFMRGCLVRRRISVQHQAASIIQRAFRMHQMHQTFLQQRAATITIQRYFRALLLRQQVRMAYADVRKACVTIQCHYRGYRARKQYHKVRVSVIKLQAAVRGYQQRWEYERLRVAATVIQRRYRARLLGHVFREAFLMIREASVVIQRYFRGYLTRQRYLQHLSQVALKHQIDAAIVLQAHTKGWLARRQAARRALAVHTLQKYARAWLTGKAVRESLQKKQNAVQVIQKAWRSHRLRVADQRERAALVLQKNFRRRRAQQLYQHKVTGIVRLQACVRGFLTRRDLAAQKLAIVKIQKRWRETLAARACRQQFLLQLGAAVVIQTAFRGYRVRLYYKIAVGRVIFLQAAFRGCIQRKRFQRIHRTVSLLQQRVRSNALARKERCNYLQKCSAAITIQRAYRIWQERQQTKKVQAAILLQSHVRRMRAQKEYAHKKRAAVILQSFVRMCQARQLFRQKQSAIITIQSQVRLYMTVRRLREEVHRRRLAASKIQRAFRQYRTLKRQQRIKQLQESICRLQSAVRLQRAVRKWLARRREEEEEQRVAAAVILQRGFRAWRARRLAEVEERQRRRETFLSLFTSVAQLQLSAVRIQRWYRNILLIRQAEEQLHSIIILQSWVRAFLQRRRYLRAREEALAVQKQREKAASVIQSAFRRWKIQQEQKRRERLITKVQAIWRGKRLRRSLNNKKIAAARRRVTEANQAATEEKKLGNRTSSALDFLLHYKQLAYILDALMHLDVATRLSPVCCERLVEVNAVGVIYRLIQSCNRSLPHMELIKYSISILLNLAKYEKTAASVYEVEESVSTLIDLMSIYREKGGAIFTRTCTLLAILGLDGRRKEEMCSDKRFVEKLQSIHALVLRKHRMQVTRAKVAAKSSLNATLPSRLHAPRALKVRPAWNLRRDSLHEIEDPFAALSLLMDTLHIGPKR